MKFNTVIENHSLEMEFSNSLDQLLIKTENNIEIDFVRINQNTYSLIINGTTYYLTHEPHLEGKKITIDHLDHQVQIKDELDFLLEKFGIQTDESSHNSEIHAQIPGLISKIFVKKEDRVEVNQKLFILEAMKMENEIYSPLAGTVDQIYYKEGDIVEKGSVIMDIII